MARNSKTEKTNKRGSFNEDLFQRKLTDSELPSKPPLISISDIALLGAILLFIILSTLTWILWPVKIHYPHKTKRIDLANTEQQLMKIPDVNDDLFEEIHSDDTEYLDPKHIEQNVTPQAPSDIGHPTKTSPQQELSQPEDHMRQNQPQK